MDNLVNFVLRNPVRAGFMALVLIVYLIWVPLFNRQRRREQRDYLSQHPDAAKVYLTCEAVNVHWVNGDFPTMFSEGDMRGFYAEPGENTVVISCSDTRPGAPHQIGTETTGEVRREIEVKPGGAYLLGFDPDERSVLFEEMTT